MSNTLAAAAEEAGELRRYRSDIVAALIGPRSAGIAGAIAGSLVFFVPVAIVAGSMLLLSFMFNFGILPLQWLVRVTGFRIPRGVPISSGQASPGATQIPTPRPTEIPPLPAEGALVTNGPEWLAVVLVLFWPFAMLAVGAAVAWLYRFRRRRQLDLLRRSPVEFAILPEFLLFYACTAGAGLLVGVGSFVALGVNVVLSWAGVRIWQALFDRFLWRVAPLHLRSEANALVQRERQYRREAREAG